MSDFIDYEYAESLARYYPRYEKVRQNPLKINFRCPLCGDSATDEFKARAWIFDSPKKNMLLFHCFNCDASMSFSNFLKDQDDTLYREYLLEKRKNDVTKTVVKKEEPDLGQFKTTIKAIEKLDFCERVDRLDKSHPILKYMEERHIPKDKLKLLWFTSQWQELVNSVNKDTYSNPKNEYRLVIPMYNPEGKIEAFQGRALNANQQPKYITIKVHDGASKIYGRERVDESKPVFVFEGPIDSLFIDNAIAISGGSLDISEVPYKGNRIWCLDDESRHKDTLARMTKLIEAGEKVCFWDNTWKGKDINEKVKNGATPEALKEYILANSYDGLMAKLKLKNYSKYS